MPTDKNNRQIPFRQSNGTEKLANMPGLTPAADIEPLLRQSDLPRVLSCSLRTVERLRVSGKLPRPDLHLGRSPRWKRSTISAWIAGGGKP
jgi:predicted DNA-binding transcriptional regulator AlpA